MKSKKQKQGVDLKFAIGQAGNYSRRELKDLNLIDNFLFGAVVTYPEIGKRFSRILLKIITGRSFEHLIVIPQKVYYGSDTKYHGTRLDVYMETSEDNENEIATIYDVEPEQKEKDAASLPKRVRFYHTKIGNKALQSGQSYRHLKRVVIIMIMPFDPFGFDRMVYTIRSHCVEEPDMPYDDGAETIFFYTHGKRGKPAQEVQEFLAYFEDSRQENAVNPTLQEIDQMVHMVKYDEEVGIKYMRWMEDEEDIRKEAFKEGQEAEHVNTLKAEREAKEAQQEIKRLKAILADHQIDAS